MRAYSQSCEHAHTVVDSGYTCCCACGAIIVRDLDGTISSFAQNIAPLCSSYTRSKRFVNKILAALLCRTAPMYVDLDLLDAVKGVHTPEEVIRAIGRHVPRPGTRRPYLHAVGYWRAAGHPIVFPKQLEINRYIASFEHIFFARERLGITGPNFPYLTLLELLVSNARASHEMRFILRFVRKLRCPRRRRKYTQQFKDCMEYIKQHGDRFGIQDDEHRGEEKDGGCHA
jgi:hypothetical protein